MKRTQLLASKAPTTVWGNGWIDTAAASTNSTTTISTRKGSCLGQAHMFILRRLVRIWCLRLSRHLASRRSQKPRTVSWHRLSTRRTLRPTSTSLKQTLWCTLPPITPKSPLQSSAWTNRAFSIIVGERRPRKALPALVNTADGLTSPKKLNERKLFLPRRWQR